MNNTSLRIGTNTLIQAVGKALSLIFSFILTGVLTRHLGVLGYGEYTTIFFYLGFFAIFSEFGIDQILVKELSKTKEDSQRTGQFISKTLSLRIMLTTISVFLAIVFSLFLPYSSIVKKGIIIGSISNFFFYSATALMSYFQVKLNFFYPVLADTLGKLTTLVTSLALILIFRKNLLLLIVAYVTGSFVVFATIFSVFEKQRIKLVFRFDPNKWHYIFSAAFPLFLISFLNQVVYRIDVVLLSFFSGTEAVGIYGLATRVLEIGILPATFLTASVFPVLAEQIKEINIFKRTFLNSLKIFLLGGLSVTIFILIAGNFLVKILGGSEFTSSILILKILTLSILPIWLTNLSSVTLITLGEQKKLSYTYFFVAVLNILLNLLLIPRFGITGAAYCFVVAQFTTIAGMYFAIINKLK